MQSAEGSTVKKGNTVGRVEERETEGRSKSFLKKTNRTADLSQRIEKGKGTSSVCSRKHGVFSVQTIQNTTQKHM